MKARSNRRVNGALLSLYLGLTLWFAAWPAQAATATYNLDYIFNPQTGTVAPLATVTLADLGAACSSMC